MRFFTVMLMVAFAPNLGVTDGPKGWIGYVILLLHAMVLVLGFFISAVQTIVEVVALMLGAGGDDDRGLTRGGLSKIFGMRQLARRGAPRNGPSRASQMSTSAMLDVEDGTKTGYSMPSGRVRSSSGASLSGMLSGPRHRDSSALDSVDMYSAGHSRAHRHVDSGSSLALDTPGGAASIFSFLTSPTAARAQNPGLPIEATDPYYRPPRRRQGKLSTDIENPAAAYNATAGDPLRTMPPKGASGDDGDESADAAGLGTGAPAATGLGIAADISRNPTPLPGAGIPANALPNRPDYSTREVDFYYGVRGPALNSDGPGRKLGTGPADPTGPVATATGWFRGLLGGKTKEKGKGFEVVRSARMPPT